MPGSPLSAHNISVVYKHFVSRLQTQFSATYSFASGRPYTDPNTGNFNSKRTPAYHDLSLSISYLVNNYLILHGSVTNVLGRDNIFGYEYARWPAGDKAAGSAHVFYRGVYYPEQRKDLKSITNSVNYVSSYTCKIMKNRIKFNLTVLMLVALYALPASAQNDYKIVVEVENIQSTEGSIRVGLFNSKNTFLEDT